MPEWHLNSIEAGKINTVIVDVTECEIERPKKKQKDYYSVKKKETHIKSAVSDRCGQFRYCMHSDRTRKRL